MADTYTPPDRLKEAFNCPYCGAFAHQVWNEVFQRPPNQGGFQPLDNARTTVCAHCHMLSWWVDGQMVHPPASAAPEPASDMPASILDDFNEARAIVGRSPRGASALLRLALQKLCVELGEPGNNLNDDIASLVAKGLLPRVQRSLDTLRVVGNNAVHPGQIDLRDDQETALGLFRAMNVIVEQLITVPKDAEALYTGLPQTALDAIQERDSGTAP